MSQMKLRNRRQMHLPDYLKPPEYLKSRSAARLRNQAKPVVVQRPIVKKRKLRQRTRGRPPKKEVPKIVKVESESEEEIEEEEGEEVEDEEDEEMEDNSESEEPHEEIIDPEEKMEELKSPPAPQVPGQPEYDHFQALLRRKVNLISANVPSPHAIALEANGATTVGTTQNENRLLIKPIIQENRLLIKPIQENRLIKPIIQENRLSKPIIQENRLSKPIIQENRSPIKPERQPVQIPAISCPICFKCFTTSDNVTSFENHLRVFHVKFWMEQTGERIQPIQPSSSKDPKSSEKKKKEVDIDPGDEYLPNCDLGPCQTCAARGLRCGVAPVCIRVVMQH